MNKLNLLHSMLSAICLGVLAWVAHTTAESSTSVAALKVEVQAIKEAMNKNERTTAEALARIERLYEVGRGVAKH
jgi:hypothetical protein